MSLIRTESNLLKVSTSTEHRRSSSVSATIMIPGSFYPLSRSQTPYCTSFLTLSLGHMTTTSTISGTSFAMSINPCLPKAIPAKASSLLATSLAVNAFPWTKCADKPALPQRNAKPQPSTREVNAWAALARLPGALICAKSLQMRRRGETASLQAVQVAVRMPTSLTAKPSKAASAPRPKKMTPTTWLSHRHSKSSWRKRKWPNCVRPVAKEA